jgi:SAM-dependent methyltransferase
LVEASRCPHGGAIVDVGAGASHLVDALLDQGFGDLTVLDIAEAALEAVRGRLGQDSGVEFIACDLLEWKPARRFDLWHDRAVFHFLDGAQRARYHQLVLEALEPGGCVIIGTFALDGPETCSGLPVTRSNAEDLEQFLGEDFELLVKRRELHTTPWDTPQPFSWVLARRRGPARPSRLS